jgi:alkaline phosphatase
VVLNAAEMIALPTATETMVSGQFGTGLMPYEYDGLGDLPDLSEMTDTALNILDNDPDGFFLMVEGGRIDHACHANDIIRSVWEIIEFSEAVQEVIDWAAGRTDTFILVTADHETGGLTVLINNDADNYPTVSWSTGGHTGVNVPMYAWGVNAEMVTGVLDNTQLFAIATTSTGPGPMCAADFDGDGDVDSRDLYTFMNGDESLDLRDEFAAEFGRDDCQE